MQKSLRLSATLHWLAGLWLLFFTTTTGPELGAYHLRQSLGLMLTMAVLWFIPIIGWILNIVLFIFLIIGLVYASQEEQKPVPVVGEFYQNLFKGIN